MASWASKAPTKKRNLGLWAPTRQGRTASELLAAQFSERTWTIHAPFSARPTAEKTTDRMHEIKIVARAEMPWADRNHRENQSAYRQPPWKPTHIHTVSMLATECCRGRWPWHFGCKLGLGLGFWGSSGFPCQLPVPPSPDYWLPFLSGYVASSCQAR